MCNCNVRAGGRTVRKDGPNKDRKFFSCGNNRSCEFFAWADADDVADEGNKYQDDTAASCYKCGKVRGAPQFQSRSPHSSKSSPASSSSSSSYPPPAPPALRLFMCTHSSPPVPVLSSADGTHRPLRRNQC